MCVVLGGVVAPLLQSTSFGVAVDVLQPLGFDNEDGSRIRSHDEVWVVVGDFAGSANVFDEEVNASQVLGERFDAVVLMAQEISES
ncbi:MAG: hypothetical protein WAN48_05830 [Actinomycetes bacterium]